MIETFEGTITALKPICHLEKTMGIASKFRRLKVFSNGKIELIPVYSGNSLRGILRRRMYYHILNRLNLSEKQLALETIFSLKQGGQLKRGEAATYDTDFECELRQNIPYLSLLGTAAKQQLIHGKLNVDMAWPICRETNFITGLDNHVSIWDLMQVMQFTRRDDREQKEPPPEDEEKKQRQAQQMLYQIEVLVPGTHFKHSFTLKDATAIERACFMRMLKEFEAYPYLGGDSRMGFGKITWTYKADDSNAYDNFLLENTEKIKDYILGGFETAK